MGVQFVIIMQEFKNILENDYFLDHLNIITIFFQIFNYWFNSYIFMKYYLPLILIKVKESQ